MKTKLSLLMLVLVLCFAMCGCGSSNDSSQDSEPAEAETSTEESTESADSSSIDELGEYYEFTFDGKDYKLPCTLADLTANGLYVSDEALDFDLEEQTFTFVDVYTDSSMEQKAFQVTVYNFSDGTAKVADTPVGNISVESDTNSPFAKGIKLKKSGVTIDITSDEALAETAEQLKAAYGTDEKVFTDRSSDGNINYEWRMHYGLPSDQQALISREYTSIQNGMFTMEYCGKIE